MMCFYHFFVIDTFVGRQSLVVNQYSKMSDSIKLFF